MKRVLIFLTLFIASMGLSFGAEYNTIILPSSYIEKNEHCVLYSKNLEEIFANNLLKNFSGAKKYTSPTASALKHTLHSNPQLNSTSEAEEKIKILAKIYGTNRIIDISIKYEIKSMNTAQNNRLLERTALLNDSTYIRLITKVNLINVSDNKTLWSNVYCKNINFETLNNKNFSPVTSYFEKLSQTVVEEIKTQSGIKPIDFKQQETAETQELHDTTVEIHNVIPKPDIPKKTTITPQLQLQENLTDKQSELNQKQPKIKKVATPKPEKNVKPKSTESFGAKLKNSIKQKFNQPTQEQETTKVKKVKTKEPKTKQIKTPEVNTEEVKTEKTNQTIQPTYTNLHVSPRKNSKNYTPQFDNSVNDI